MCFEDTIRRREESPDQPGEFRLMVVSEEIEYEGVTYDSVFDELKNTPLLILDDLGREHSSPWAEEKLYQIMVHRHEARLPTVITTSIGMDDLEESNCLLYTSDAADE